MDDLEALRLKLLQRYPDEPVEYQCANCMEYNSDPQCWYCGYLRK